ncbi:DUF1501 domain-containing protein [Schlesneria paludicola]|uniref:DUF1501 domain-containing protein n=1 Tax=Schlesneria paludicola TaxID=360056 RepID=UPI000299EC2C|nr:DUF1501 domain-containing protein [Schlesneria paludicola]
MPPRKPLTHDPCQCHARRTFLADLGMGFTGLALGAMLSADGITAAADAPSAAPHEDTSYEIPTGQPHFVPRTKSVIWIFLSGGYSHVETFDPKPALNQYAGMTFDKTPFENPVNSPLQKKRFRSVLAEEINIRDVYPTIFPMQVGWKKHGESGIEVTDWWPHLAECVDDLCFIRNMWTTDNDHAAENQIHTGRHRLDEPQPSVGSWVNYGLGSMNDNLPKFVVLGGPTRSDTRQSIDSYYLGSQYAGIPLTLDPKEPLPFGRRVANQTATEQLREFQLINRLNELSAVEYPDDQDLRARIRAYEMAFKMQTAVPEAIDFTSESEATTKLYGLDNETTKAAGEKLLAARKLVERGVRFVQVFPSPYGVWDSHQKLKDNHTRLCGTVDKPVAGLIQDLKQRGLMEDVTVVFCTEFGRTPGLELRAGGKDGRDHHPNGFTVWMAGAGIKRGHIHGATDELGYHALGEGHYVTDLHATVLHLLGMDNRRLEIPGRKRLEIDHGRVIDEILTHPIV